MAGVGGRAGPDWAALRSRPFSFERNVVCSYCYPMTAVEIIEEIKRLPEAEQHRVIQFARNADENRQLDPDELGKLAKQMVEAKDPAEADRLKAEIVRGFYGGQPHA